ncbi:MAG: hypothetical protein ABIG68_01930 [Acidobacteriota bacterium]
MNFSRVHGLNGGMFIAYVSQSGTQAAFGTPKITLAGNSNIRVKSNALKIAR